MEKNIQVIEGVINAFYRCNKDNSNFCRLSARHRCLSFNDASIEHEIAQYFEKFNKLKTAS